MLVIYLVLYVLASACFLAFSFGQPAGRVNLLGLGVFFWSLVPILETAQKL